jgi:penicillin-binding protein-related factor A (putative recombinase)
MNYRQRGYQNKKSGQFGEDIARLALQSYGVKMIEKVNTPWTILWKKDPITGKNIPSHAFPSEKVSGDFIGIWETGIKVLVEVKKYDDKLSLSVFSDDQIKSLTDNATLGAMSLIVWVRKSMADIYLWPQMRIIKGEPMKPGALSGMVYRYQF